MSEILEDNMRPERDYTWFRRAVTIATGLALGATVTCSPHEAQQNNLPPTVAQHDDEQHYIGRSTMFEPAENYLQPHRVLLPWTVPNLSCVYFQNANGEMFNIFPQQYQLTGADNNGKPTTRTVPSWEYAAIIQTVPSC